MKKLHTVLIALFVMFANLVGASNATKFKYLYGGDSASAWSNEWDGGCTYTYSSFVFSQYVASRNTITVYAFGDRYNYCTGVESRFEGQADVPITSFTTIDLSKKTSAKIKGSALLTGTAGSFLVNFDLVWSPPTSGVTGNSTCVSHYMQIGPWGVYRYAYHSSAINADVSGTAQIGSNAATFAGDQSSGGVITHDRGQSSSIYKP